MRESNGEMNVQVRLVDQADVGNLGIRVVRKYASKDTAMFCSVIQSARQNNTRQGKDKRVMV